MTYQQHIFAILSVFLILILIINWFFVRTIVNNSIVELENTSQPLDRISKTEEDQSEWSNISSNTRLVEFIQEKIRQQIEILPSKYFDQNVNYINVLDSIISELEIIESSKDIINALTHWPNAQHLIPPVAPELGTIIEILRKLKIVKVDNSVLGTQLKLMLTFENGFKAIFKPQWYSRYTKIVGPVYNGKDRHNAEVVAFYLSLLLSFRRVPLTLIRKLDLKQEVFNTASPELLLTMYQKDNTTCLYGKCHYCSSSDPVCGIADVLEGATILWLPPNRKLIKYKHPWQRTYAKTHLAQWEVDMNYCNRVKQSKTYSPEFSHRLLDIIDAAIFDFLLDNGDRHHYELIRDNSHDPTVLLIDNGKSLGNPNVDHIDILAPLYQCCIIYKSTWERLQLFSGGAFSYSLRKLLKLESSRAKVLPLITDEHLTAIDRRLLTIFGVIEFCLKKSSYSFNVIFIS